MTTDVQDPKYNELNLALAAIDDGFQDHVKILFKQLADYSNDDPRRYTVLMNGYRKAVDERVKFRKLITDSEPPQ